MKTIRGFIALSMLLVCSGHALAATVPIPIVYGYGDVIRPVLNLGDEYNCNMERPSMQELLQVWRVSLKSQFDATKFESIRKDERYTKAMKVFSKTIFEDTSASQDGVEQATNRPFIRAVEYLIKNGVRKMEAEENLKLLLAGLYVDYASDERKFIALNLAFEANGSRDSNIDAAVNYMSEQGIPKQDALAELLFTLAVLDALRITGGLSFYTEHCDIGYFYKRAHLFHILGINWGGKFVLYQGDRYRELSSDEIKSYQEKYGNLTRKVPWWVRYNNILLISAVLLLMLLSGGNHRSDDSSTGTSLTSEQQVMLQGSRLIQDEKYKSALNIFLATAKDYPLIEGEELFKSYAFNKAVDALVANGVTKEEAELNLKILLCAVIAVKKDSEMNGAAKRKG